MSEPVTGASMIAAERRRQVEVEGWTAEHDDTEHANGELARAAAAYALSATPIYRLPILLARTMKGIIDDLWPWEPEWFKPKGKPDAVIRSLVKAGALIAAEIDRRLRKRDAAAASTSEEAADRLTESELRGLAVDAFDVLNWAKRMGLKRDDQIAETVKAFEVRLGYRQPRDELAASGEALS